MDKNLPITIKKEVEDVTEVPDTPQKIPQNNLLINLLASEVCDKSNPESLEIKNQPGTVKTPQKISSQLWWPEPHISANKQLSSKIRPACQTQLSLPKQLSSKIRPACQTQQSLPRILPVGSQILFSSTTSSNSSPNRLPLSQIPSASSTLLGPPLLPGTLILNQNKPPLYLLQVPGNQQTLLKINSPLPCSLRKVQPNPEPQSIEHPPITTQNKVPVEINVPVPLSVTDKVAKPKKKPRKRYVYSKPKKRSKKKKEPSSALPPLSDPSLELSNKDAGEDVDSDKSSDTIIADEGSNNESIGTSPETITEPSNETSVGKTVNPPVKLLLIGKTVYNLTSGIGDPRISSPTTQTTYTKTASPQNIFPITAAIKVKENIPVANSLIPVLNNKETAIIKEVGTTSKDIELPKIKRKQTARRGKGKARFRRMKATNQTDNFGKVDNKSFENPLQAAVMDELINSSLLETTLPENPQSIRAATIRKSPRTDDQAVTTGSVNPVLKVAANNEDLALTVSPGKAKRTKATSKKNNAKSTPFSEDVLNLHRKYDEIIDEVVGSSLALSVKTEQYADDCHDWTSSAKSSSFATTTGQEASETSIAISKTSENLVFKLHCEEDVTSKDDTQDARLLLEAFRRRNAKGRFVKSSSNSTNSAHAAKQPNVGNSSNTGATTTLANELKTSTPITKALPVSYLANFEKTKLNSDPPTTDTLKTSSSTQVQGCGLPLNIKKEVTEATSTDNRLPAMEEPPKDLSLLNQSAIEPSISGSLPVQSNKRKQTARRGRKRAPALRALLPTNESVPDVQNPATGDSDLVTIQPPQQTPNESTPELSNSATGDQALASIQPPQIVKRKQTARRGRANGKTQQAKSKEAADDLVKKSLDILTQLEPTGSSQEQQQESVPISTSMISDSQVHSTVNSQFTVLSQKHASTAKIIIKTEPQEYEVITLEDSPIKKTHAVTSVGSEHISHNNSVAASVKKELFTEHEPSVAVTDKPDNPVSLSLPHLSLVESSSTTTASPILATPSLVSEEANRISALADILPSVAASINKMRCESNSGEKNYPLKTVPFIKKEVDDFHVVQKIPTNSVFVNCLNSSTSINEPQTSANSLPMYSTNTVNQMEVPNIPAESLEVQTEIPAGNLPVYSTPTVNQEEDSFQSSDYNKASLSTLEKVWNQPGPSTDAVYSSTITKGLVEAWNKLGPSTEAVYTSTIADTSRQDIYDDPMEREFHQSSTPYYEAKDQNTFIRGHSGQDAVAFAGVSIESLKNIIGNVDILSESGARDTSLSLQDDGDTSSQTSSFYSRSSPRLSTPLSDSVSLRLTDSVSPLTRVSSIPSHDQNVEDPRSSSQNGSNDSSLKGKIDPMLPDNVQEDETDELKYMVALKLRLAYSLPQYSIVHEGDLVPLENYPVGDGEVECFHKLLATSYADLTSKLESPAFAPTATETVIPDSIIEESSAKIDLNRTAMLDQFIKSKIVEERDQMTFGEHKTQSIIDLIEQAKREGGLKSSVYTRGATSYSDLSLEQYAVRRSNLSFSSEDGPDNIDRQDKISNATVKSDNYIPLLSEAPFQSNSKVNSFCSSSAVPDENFKTLPHKLDSKQPGSDLSLIIPDMLKIITKCKESSSKTTTANLLHEPLLEVGDKQVETENKKPNDSIGQNIPTVSQSLSNRSTSSKDEDYSPPSKTNLKQSMISPPSRNRSRGKRRSRNKLISSIIAPPSTTRSRNCSSSPPRTNLIPTLISSPKKKSNSKSGSPPKKKSKSSISPPPLNRNLINISLPSNDLLYEVIQSTKLSSKDGLGSSLPSKPNVDENLVEKDVLKIPHGLSETSSYLSKTSSNADYMMLSNFEATRTRQDIVEPGAQVKTIDNLTFPKPSETSSAKSFASPAETQPKVHHYSESTFNNADTVENFDEPSTTESTKSISIADKINVAELLKILNTAKSMQMNAETPPPEVFPHHDETPFSEQSIYQNSPHHYQASNYAPFDDNRYAYEDNYMIQNQSYTDEDKYRMQHPGYTGGSNFRMPHPCYTEDYTPMKVPIVMDYDHKPPPSNPPLQVTTHMPVANETERIASIPVQDNAPDDSGSDVDNEFVGNESDSPDLEESVPEEPALLDNPVKESVKEKITEKDSQSFPQYKSRWEKIMESKSLTYEDICSAKVPHSKATIQKPIAHVQPCSQSLLKKKPIQKNTKKRGAVDTGSVQKKKSKISKSSLSIQENKKDVNLDSSLLPEKRKMKKVSDIPENYRQEKKNKDSVNKSKTHSKNNSSTILSPKNKSKSPTVHSSIANKSTLDKTINKTHRSKSRSVSFEGTSTLFSPDSVIKRKEVKNSGNPLKVDDEASKRLYGRVANRGVFLTESSKKETPKSKALLKKKSTDKTKTPSKYCSEELHSMISTPEIQITPKSDLLQRHSNKLSLESYKRKRGIFSDISTGIGSPKVNFHREVVLNTPRPMSSSIAFSSCASPDISYHASSDSSDFFSPTQDPFESDVTSTPLPSFETNKPAFSRALLPTPDVIPTTTQHSTYVKRPLLPDPVPRIRQQSQESYGNSQFDNLLFSNSPVESSSSPLIQQPAVSLVHHMQQPIVPPVPLVQQPIVPSVPIVEQQILPPVSSRHRHSRPRATTCVCLPPKSLKTSVGSNVFETFDVMLLILEWNVDWLFQQQKNLEPPPICNSKKKISNTYLDFEDYYNTYLPLLLLETWQRIYESWTHLNQAPPYFCEITSYDVETHTIKVQCQAVFRSSDAKKGLLPEEGNVIMVKFGTKEKGGIKILGYVTDVKITSFDPSNQSQNTCYRTLKYTASEVLQRLTLTFLGAYNSEDFDKSQLIRIQVLCNIKPTLKQNDALLGINKSPLYRSILNPMNDGLRIVNMPSRNPDPLKVSETLNECVRDIITGIISPHQVPILTIAKTTPSSDKMSVFLPLVEKMKNSYRTKVLLCTRTSKALTDIGCHLEGGTVKVVITSKRSDVHHKLRKYHLEDLAAEKATSNIDPPPIPGFQKVASKKAIESAKVEIIKDCDVILSNVRGCHTKFLEQACENDDGLSRMCCIIDEAHLCTEPEILNPLLYGISKLILIGDPDERAKVCSKTAVHYDYDRSLFHRANDLDLASE
ncbi:hypothetical protein JTE90_015269 [Oedothorax gibbosus]|uniref:DNA2/NAM7 helicase helicase domain-containing protein n=1 Tax=Oedothorax gibbosus TaxID=931172 RepID=A0AAV6UBR4_9ARAC|nr:hypothetical protein JTE90_015269 [Oedothorax gibbosus]